MATEVILPRLGQGMESGTIVRWLKSEGEPVEKGEPLFELDTDKVTQEVEAETNGVLLKIAVAEGEVPVGQTVAFIGAEGEDVPEVVSEAPAAPAAEEPSDSLLQANEETAPAADASGNGRIKASPLARRRQCHLRSTRTSVGCVTSGPPCRSNTGHPIRARRRSNREGSH